MAYHFSAPGHYPTDEEKKLEFLKYLSDSCWLADSIHKEESKRQIVYEHDYVAFFVEKNPYFDYPDAEIINELGLHPRDKRGVALLSKRARRQAVALRGAR